MSLHTGIKFKTSAPLSAIEDWMDENCQEAWEVEIESINTAMHQKTVAAYFESENDRDAFKAAYKNIR